VNFGKSAGISPAFAFGLPAHQLAGIAPAFFAREGELSRIDPDYSPTDAELENFAKLLGYVGRIGSVHSNGTNGFQKALLVVTTGLAILGIGGVVGMYGKLSAIDAQLTDLRDELQKVEKLVEPRYRSG